MKLQKRPMLKKFVFASTAAVYGDYKTLFKENDKKKPINNYGASKLKFEEYLSDNKKLNTVILRFFNVTGKFYIKENKINKNDSVILKKYLKLFRPKKVSISPLIQKNQLEGILYILMTLSK